MQEFIKRYWFSLFLLAGLLLSYSCPNLVRPVTNLLQPRFTVAVSLFLIACSLENGRLVGALLHPIPALWAVAISYGLTPALGWLVNRMVPNPDYRVGLLIITSVPCTLASAVLWTRLANGNEATALLAIVLTTSTSWLTTTGWLLLATGADVEVNAAGMMFELALVLIVPVALAQLSRVVAPFARTADRWRIPIGIIAQLLILSIIIKAAVDVFERLSEKEADLDPGSLAFTALACIGIHLAALWFGRWSGRLLHFSRADQIAVGFAGSQKTLPVSLFLFDAYFKETYPLAVVPCLIYHVGQLVLDTVIAGKSRRTAVRGL